ncbi:unnamed protein product [Pedinophyceae sp. YPF-701]|nr:unnamed protein product [Pedinophyceae sp. YPF-701]
MAASQDPRPGGDEEDKEGGEDVCVANSHFKEADEVLELIAEVERTQGAQAEHVHDRVRAILVQYQEQPQLLDGHLEAMLLPLAAVLKALARDPASDLTVVQQVSRILQTISTVRGAKQVARFMPHEARDLEPAVALLARLRASDPTSAGAWEAKAVVLLWLTILALVPFDIRTLDTAAAGGEVDEEVRGHDGARYPVVVLRIMRMTQDFLSDPGLVRDAAGTLLGTLLARRDMTLALADFIQWAAAAVEAEHNTPKGAFLLPGVTNAFSSLCKKAERTDLLPRVAELWPLARVLAERAEEHESVLARKLATKLSQRLGLILLEPRAAAWRYRKEVASLAANLGDAGGAGGAGEAGGDDADDFEVAAEVEEVIDMMLTGLRDRDTVVRWSAAKGLGRLTGRLPRALGDEVATAAMELMSPAEGDSAWHGACLALAELARRGLLLPARLPDVAPLVCAALAYDVRRGACSVGAHVRDAAAYVCWAFARAYSERELRPLVEAVAPAMLSTACYDREVMCRRAAAAAFQECVGRLGSFKDGIEILGAADFFTLSMRSQAYLEVAPFVASFGQYTIPLVEYLIDTKLHHWDEAVRQLSARALARLAPVATEWLASVGLSRLVNRCTDAVLEVRHGAALGLAALLPALRAQGALGGDTEDELVPAAHEAMYVAAAVDKARLFRGKGGEIMRGAVCHVISSYALARMPIPVKERKGLLGLIEENLRHPNEAIAGAAVAALACFTRGFMRTANPKYTEVTAGRHVPLLADPNPAVRRGSALAVGYLPGHLLAPVAESALAALRGAVEASGPAEDQDAEARRNAARALATAYEMLFACAAAGDAWELPRAGAKGTPGAGPFEDGAVDGIDGEAATACEEPWRAAGAADARAWAAEGVRLAVEAVLPGLVAALGDFAADNRGDVGSWVREAACTSSERVLRLLARLVEAAGGEVSAELRTAVTSVVGAVAGQTLERIGRLRGAAVIALLGVVQGGDAAPAALLGAPEVGSLAGAFRHVVQVPAGEPPRALVAACMRALDGYTAAAKALLRDCRAYRVEIGRALVAAAGGLDPQLAAAASEALLPEGPANTPEHVGELVLRVWEGRAPRLATPLLRVAALLLSRGGLVGVPAGGGWDPAALVANVRGEARGCRDVGRLRAAADALVQAVEARGGAGRAALTGLMLLLCNGFPRVRKHAAESLYVALLAADAERIEGPDNSSLSQEQLMELTGLLVGGTWEGALGAAKESRAGILALLGIEVKAAAAARNKQDAGATDENASYSALVQDAMRDV